MTDVDLYSNQQLWGLVVVRIKRRRMKYERLTGAVSILSLPSQMPSYLAIKSAGLTLEGSLSLRNLDQLFMERICLLAQRNLNGIGLVTVRCSFFGINIR